LLGSIDRHLTELDRLRRPGPPRLQRGRLGPATGRPTLTPRERVVLGLVAEGRTASATAHRLGISVHTVNKHLENLYRKLGTKDRLTSVLLARELGLLDGLGPARTGPRAALPSKAGWAGAGQRLVGQPYR
jgi:DNA-binding CsgD family transcriptional regulator